MLTRTDRARLAELCQRYAEQQYPGIEVLNELTPEQAERRSHTARSTAVQIADFVIDKGLHRTRTGGAG
jgi:hypothetical protein